MKKLILLLSAFATLAFVSCSKDDDQGPEGPVVCPKDHIEVVSFEAAEQMTDFVGEPATPGDITVIGGSAAATHKYVLWAGSSAYVDYMQTTITGATYYDGPLFSTTDENIWFGSYYSDNLYDGVKYESWGGFVLTRNFGKTATTVDYQNQFTAWADKGAKGSATCMIGYDSFGGDYSVPTIDFVKSPRKACHLYMANTAITHPYEPTNVVTPATYYYKVVIIGKLKKVETGRVECMLIKNGVKVEDWVFVDLSSLGTVDQIQFKAESNDAGEYMNAPTYFALDELGFAK